MSEEVVESSGPFIDFSFQFNLARDKVEKKIFQYLCDLAKELYLVKNHIGVLIVYGTFSSTQNTNVIGMRKLGNEKIEKYINVNSIQSKEDVVRIFSEGNDGAIVVNQDGQILGTKIYLTVDNPSVEIPEGTGTRHISAASFSTRRDVLAAFTLSEETFTVRVWKDGSYVEQFYPSEEKGDKEEGE